jgi:hypothetical protein
MKELASSQKCPVAVVIPEEPAAVAAAEGDPLAPGAELAPHAESTRQAPAAAADRT